MESAIAMVSAFHKKYGFPIGVPIHIKPELKLTYQVMGEMLIGMAKSIEERAVHLQKKEKDPTLYRVHLILEELGELLVAFSQGNETEIFDGLIDLSYVIVGFSVTFGFPLSKGFTEVHRSNMTKAHRSESGERMRNKGADYQPPQLVEILKLFRSVKNE
jgi:hypothetical protein